MSASTIDQREVEIRADDVQLSGDLQLPPQTAGLVIFAHGSGSSRRSERNRHVASALNDAGLATLLFDLLSEEEEAVDRRTAHLRFDIPLLTRRLTATVDWVKQIEELQPMKIGLFGASTGAAAALGSAAVRPDDVHAVVSRGGRPDLADAALPDVRCPVLLIVGGDDGPVIDMNNAAAAKMPTPPEVKIVAGASHLFEEPGKLDEVATLARDFFQQQLLRA